LKLLINLVFHLLKYVDFSFFNQILLGLFDVLYAFQNCI